MKLKPVQWAAVVLAVIGIYGLYRDVAAAKKADFTLYWILRDWLPLVAAAYFFFQ